VGGVAFVDDRVPFAMVDGNYIMEEFKEAKAAGTYAVNMDRIPMLSVDGKPVLGQSKSIERYVAGVCGLMGSSALEAAQIDMVGEHVRDIKDAFNKAKGANTLEAFLAEELGPKFLKPLDKVVGMLGQPGFAVGSKLSLAGLQIWQLATDFLAGNAAEAEKAMAGCDALKAVVAAVAANEKLQAWLAARPVTIF